ncbi:transmembrane protein sting [Ptiloglossa arizonensis]|uniref:transmembrane protein sting n=1 Tax=Ptiloglossa arizonensis TaxID=3350558 RepID=UPI003F9F49E0
MNTYTNNKLRLYVTSCIGVVILLIGMCIQVTDNDNNPIFIKYLLLIVFVFNIVLMIDILIQFCQYVMHLLFTNCYNINTMTATKSSFRFDETTSVLSIYLIIFISLTIGKSDQEIKVNLLNRKIQNIVLLCTPWILFLWMFLKIIDFNNQCEENISTINLMQGLDYGTGMAYNYYYGYLRLILPSTGTFNKGLIEKIENIEDSHNITIATHKLFILIPSSSHIPPDLKEVAYQWMESAIDLEEEIRDRAGIKRRSYHNNVYKIYPGGKKLNSKVVYVVVEGATPLLTFFEVQKHAHPETTVYQKYRKDIINKFYNKLKELINNDPECANLCELIYYDDYDNDGIKTNVAKVILQKLSEICDSKSG